MCITALHTVPFPAFDGILCNLGKRRELNLPEIRTGVIAVLLTGLVLVNVPPFWQEVLVGAVLILAVYIDQLRGRRQRS